MSKNSAWIRWPKCKRSSRTQSTPLQVETLEARMTMSSEPVDATNSQATEPLDCSTIQYHTVDHNIYSSERICQTNVANSSDDAETNPPNLKSTSPLDHDSPIESLEVEDSLDEREPGSSTESVPAQLPAEGTTPGPEDTSTAGPDQVPVSSQETTFDPTHGLASESTPGQSVVDLPTVSPVAQRILPPMVVEGNVPVPATIELQLRDVSNWVRAAPKFVGTTRSDVFSKLITTESSNIDSRLNNSASTLEERARLSPQIVSVAALMPIIQPKTFNKSRPVSSRHTPASQQQGTEVASNVSIAGRLGSLENEIPMIGANEPKVVARIDPLRFPNEKVESEAESHSVLISPEDRLATEDENRKNSLLFLALVGMFSFSPLLKKGRSKSSVRRDKNTAAEPLQVVPVAKSDCPCK